MRLLILLSIGLLFASTVRAQDCRCPENRLVTANSKPDRLFQIGKKTIGLCGYFEIRRGDTCYSEFILYDCETKKIEGEWDATQTCKISASLDTLTVEELYNLPVGPQFEYNIVPFYTTRLFHNGKALGTLTFFNELPRRFSDDEIDQVLSEYKQLQTNPYSTNSEKYITMADMLFCGYLSGSINAEKKLIEFKDKFAPPFDGANAETWDELWGMYLLSKERKLQ